MRREASSRPTIPTLDITPNTSISQPTAWLGRRTMSKSPASPNVTNMTTHGVASKERWSGQASSTIANQTPT
jgi:hypothetical protein